MKEPFRTIYFTLMANRHPVGAWRYNVKIANSGEAIYIGDDFNHCTVLKGHDGYHHTEDRYCANGQHESYTTIEKMLERAEYNPGFYTRGICEALGWLQKNQTAM